MILCTREDETAPGGLVVEHSAGVREVVGSIPGRVIPKTLKMVLDADGSPFKG